MRSHVLLLTATTALAVPPVRRCVEGIGVAILRFAIQRLRVGAGRRGGLAEKRLRRLMRACDDAGDDDNDGDAAAAERESSSVSSSSPSDTARHAIVTLCCGEEYTLGAAVLAHSVARHSPALVGAATAAAASAAAAAVVVLVPDGTHLSDAAAAVLRRSGCRLRRTPRALSDDEWAAVCERRAAARQSLYPARWERSTFDKLALWTLTEFDKVLYLDADTVAVQDVRGAFEYDELAAVLPDNVTRFNSGVMVLRPSRATYDKLREALLHEHWREAWPERYPFPYGDQPLLQYFFAERFRAMDTAYNRTAKMPVRGARVVHYNAPIKPWDLPSRRNLLCRAMWTDDRAAHWFEAYERLRAHLRRAPRRGAIGDLASACSGAAEAARTS